MDLNAFYYDFLCDLVKSTNVVVSIECGVTIPYTYYYHISRPNGEKVMRVLFLEGKVYAWQGFVYNELSFESSISDPNSLDMVSKFILEKLNDKYF